MRGCFVLLHSAAETCDPAQIKKTLDGMGKSQKAKCGALAATAKTYVTCMDDEKVIDKQTCKVPTDEQRCACYSTITEPEAEKFNCKATMSGLGGLGGVDCGGVRAVGMQSVRCFRWWLLVWHVF